MIIIDPYPWELSPLWLLVKVIAAKMAKEKEPEESDGSNDDQDKDNL